MLTQEQLKARLVYNPLTGHFQSKVTHCALGWKTEYGYVRLNIDNQSYLAHRLAWLYMTGAFPKGVLDHIDRNRLNNRWENLREVTDQENSWNRVAKSKSGHVGVYRHGNRWRAEITNNYKKIRIGSFKTKEEAIVAYQNAAKLRTYKQKEAIQNVS